MSDFLNKLVDVVSCDMQVLEDSLWKVIKNTDNDGQEDTLDIIDYLESNLHGTLSVIRSARAALIGFDEPVPVGSNLDLEASVLRDIASINTAPRPSRLGATWR